MFDIRQPQNKFERIIGNRWVLLGSLLLFALVLNREGDRLPTGNEFVYLLYFYKAWHPGFLATDWTFQETTAGHAVFSYSLGWLTLLLPLEVVAWIGRLACWTAAFIGLFRLGRHFKIPPLAVWPGIVLWLLDRQSLVTRDWMVGTFEAKVIAYPCLLFAIDAALSKKNLLAGVLCGIAFSFHSAVGMWGGAALGAAVLATSPIRQTLIFAAATVVFSLPGLITSLPLILGKHAISPAEAKYLTTIALPDCFDPVGFPTTWLAAMFVLPIFSLLHALWQREDKQIRQLLIFEIALATFFAFGVFARAIGRFDWVELYPMRVFAVFALLLFSWRAITVALSWTTNKPAPRLVGIVGVLIFLTLPSPVHQLRDMLASHLTRFLHKEIEDPNASIKGDDADFKHAALWIKANTADTDVVIAPPWWNDSYYTMRRPLIANWHAPRYDQLTEWKRRIELLVGDTSHLKIEDAQLGEMDAAAWVHYASLSPEAIEQIRRLDEPQVANWLVTTGEYPYRLVFSAGTYRVYRLP